MTGLCGDASNLYIGDSSANRTWRCHPLPVLPAKTACCTFTGIHSTRDIALDAYGGIWVATDHPGCSIRAYDTAGRCIATVTEDEVPDAHGMAFDADGFLWVCDMTGDKLYKIDLQAGIE